MIPLQLFKWLAPGQQSRNTLQLIQGDGTQYPKTSPPNNILDPPISALSRQHNLPHTHTRTHIKHNLPHTHKRTHIKHNCHTHTQPATHTHNCHTHTHTTATHTQTHKQIYASAHLRLLHHWLLLLLPCLLLLDLSQWERVRMVGCGLGVGHGGRPPDSALSFLHLPVLMDRQHVLQRSGGLGWRKRFLEKAAHGKKSMRNTKIYLFTTLKKLCAIIGYRNTKDLVSFSNC